MVLGRNDACEHGPRAASIEPAILPCEVVKNFVPGLQIRGVVVAVQEHTRSMRVLPQNEPREDDELKADAREDDGRVPGGDALGQGGCDGIDLGQGEGDFAPQVVGGAAVEDADLGGDDAAHGGDGGEGVFGKGEPEVAAVVCAKGDIVEGGAEEPG